MTQLIEHIEVWKPIPFLLEVEASEFGHIRRASDGKILGQHLDQWGYFTFVFRSRDSEARKRIRTSIGVCAAFFGQRPTPKHVACHNNGIRTDNRAVNLRWGTQRENIHDKYGHGTMGFGEKNGFSKITENDVKIIRKLCEGGRYGGGEKQRDVAGRFGITQAAVSLIVRRKVWPHI